MATDHAYSMQGGGENDKKRKRSGCACAVGECSMRNSDGVSLHGFPKEPALNRQWTNFVKTCRANFVQSSNSKICELHFTRDCYPLSLHLKREEGMAPKHKMLLATAVPTIQKHSRSKPTTIAAKKLKMKSRPTSASTTTAATTNTSQQSSFAVTMSSATTATTTVITTATTATTTTVTTARTTATTETATATSAYGPLRCNRCVIESAQTDLGVTVVRGAYAERGRRRILDEAFQELPCTNNPQADLDMDDDTENFPTNDNNSEAVPIDEAEASIQHNRSSTGRQNMVHVVQKLPKVKRCNKKVWVQERYFVRHKGSLPSKTLLFLRHMGVVSISDDTFFDHQRAFLHPAIERVWEQFQDNYVQLMKERGKKLTLGGDGRADSPGHCAKFGTYTMMDLDYMLVVDVRTVQSNEAGNSNLMENAGFLLSLDFFKEKELEIGEFVSDRHAQIMKYVRENTTIKHSIDVWHVAKGLKKKLTALAKEKECELLSEWQKSIINHLYWIPATSSVSHDMSDEDKEQANTLKLAKWTSLVNHLHNVHTHSGPDFPACLHPPLIGCERNKKWLKAGSKLSVKLDDILGAKRLRQDVTMLSTGPQTAAAESFHANINRFAPKMIGFCYEGIAHRIILAAMDFNENSNRNQAVRQDGSKRYHFSFRKAKKDFTLQEVKVNRTYRYVECLMSWVASYASTMSLGEMEELALAKAQPHVPLCSHLQQPDKEEAAAQIRTRYNKLV